MKKISLILTALLLVLSLQAAPAGFSQYKLSNGLSVYLWEDHEQHNVHGYMAVNAGSIDEPETATGLAHYLEHMLFKGTQTIGSLDWEKERPYYEQIINQYGELAKTTDDAARAKIQQKINELSIQASQYTATDEFSNLIQSIGGEDLNAYTTYDYTCYHNTFPAYEMERWLTLYADRLINPVFRSFQSELENVFEEYNMYDDNNNSHLTQFVFSHLYEGHPYSRDVIGYPQDLKNPHLKELIDFFDSWYVANNMALFLVGDFDTETVKPLIEQQMSKLPSKAIPERPSYPETDFSSNQTHKAKLGYVPQILLGYNAPKAGEADELPLQFTMSILSNSMSVGLLDRLMLENKLTFAEAGYDSRRDRGRIMIEAIPYMDAESQTYESLGSTEKFIHKAVQQLIDGDFDDELLAAVQENYRQEYLRIIEYPEMKIQLMIQAYLQGISVEQMLQQQAQIARFTKSDVIAMAKKYLDKPYMLFNIDEGDPKRNPIAKPEIKPLESPKEKSLYAQQFEQLPTGRVQPHFSDFNEVSSEDIYNRVHLYCTENPQNDIFTLTLKYGIGTMQMPLLEYATSMMNLAGLKGNPRKSPYDFRFELAKLGGKCTYSVSDSYLTVNIEGADRNFAQIVELVNLQMLFPDFSSEDDRLLNNIKGQAYMERRMEEKNTDIIAAAANAFVLYGNQSRYLQRPSLADILQLTTTTLEGEFHRAFDYELEIHYVGTHPIDSVRSMVASHLPMNSNAIPTTAPVERARQEYQNTQVFFLNEKQMQQAIVYLYINGKPYSTDDAVAYNAFNEYFSGSFSGLVLNEIREKRSMAYYAYGHFVKPARQERLTYFYGQMGTQNDKVADAVDVYMSLISDMPQYPDKMESIRTILRQSLLASRPTFRNKSQTFVAWQRLGYQHDPAIMQVREIQRMKFDKITDFYENNVHGKPVVITIVGNQKYINLKQIESKYGKVKKLSKSKIFSSSGMD